VAGFFMRGVVYCSPISSHERLEFSQMKRFALALFYISFVTGCSSESPKADMKAETVENTPAPAPAPQQTAGAPIPGKMVATLTDQQRPATLDDFKKQFVSLYAKDIYAPFVELAYWGKSTDAQKRKYLEGVQETYSQPELGPKPTITDADVEFIEVVKYDAAYFPSQGEEGVKLTPQPTHIFHTTAHFNKNTSVQEYFAVGAEGGKYYFCTIAEQQ
jgi:hypothetical protein